MEFAWTAEQLAFRKRLRDLLDNELLIGWEDAAKHGPGGDSVVAFASRFCPALASHGLLVRHWPREYGGEDGKPWEHFILGEEMFAAGEPRGPQYMNVNWIGPAIMRYGKPEQKRFHLPQIANGTAFWCQGFSEPSAGSDLASLRTRAVKTADGYVINGSKIWTSYATAAEYCFLLARMGESKKGISVFLVRMDTPGIDVRQIKGIVADGSLNEVFLTDVKVREADRLGEDGRGWEVVTHALAQERVGSAKYAYARPRHGHHTPPGERKIQEPGRPRTRRPRGHCLRSSPHVDVQGHRRPRKTPRVRARSQYGPMVNGYG